MRRHNLFDTAIVFGTAIVLASNGVDQSVVSNYRTACLVCRGLNNSSNNNHNVAMTKRRNHAASRHTTLRSGYVSQLDRRASSVAVEVLTTSIFFSFIKLRETFSPSVISGDARDTNDSYCTRQ
jgi:hypothetical protein